MLQPPLQLMTQPLVLLTGFGRSTNMGSIGAPRTMWHHGRFGHVLLTLDLERNYTTEDCKLHVTAKVSLRMCKSMTGYLARQLTGR